MKKILTTQGAYFSAENVDVSGMSSVRMECDACGGTGLVRSTHEKTVAKKYAVVCFRCDGGGFRECFFVPFLKRKPKLGITHVGISPALWGGKENVIITYKEFRAWKVPQLIKRK
jgi:hypothetical protein